MVGCRKRYCCPKSIGRFFFQGELAPELLESCRESIKSTKTTRYSGTIVFIEARCVDLYTVEVRYTVVAQIPNFETERDSGQNSELGHKVGETR